MQTTILRQQAQLELGNEEYARAVEESTRFVKWLLAKGYYDKNRLLSGEGSAAQMIETALTYIVNAGDINKGIKEYFKILSYEYDSKKEHNNYESLDTLVDTEDTYWREGSVVETAGIAKRSSLPLEGLRFIQDMSQIERDVMEVIASVGAPASPGRSPSQGGTREAAAILGLPLADVRRAYRRVRARAKGLTHTLYNVNG